MPKSQKNKQKLILTAAEFKEKLADEGITLKQWAQQRNYDPEYCSKVLNGMIKGVRGKGHQIAKEMQIK